MFFDKNPHSDNEAESRKDRIPQIQQYMTTVNFRMLQTKFLQET